MHILDTFLNFCCGMVSAEPDDDLNDASIDLMNAMASSRQIRQRALELLLKLPPHGASWLAIIFGTMVEQGHAPQESLPPLLDLLRKNLAILPVFEEDGHSDPDLDDLDEEQLVIVEALPMLGQALIIHLSRAPEALALLAQDASFRRLLETSSTYSFVPVWVMSLMDRTSGDLLALHPASGRAILLRYTNVENCFHLFTLVQCVLGKQLPHSSKPAKKFVQAAKGLVTLDEGEVRSCWHFGLPGFNQPDLAHGILGDANVRSIPLIDEVQVMLLWPPLDSEQTWSSDYFGPILEAALPDMTLVRELSAEEAAGWFSRLNITL